MIINPGLRTVFRNPQTIQIGVGGGGVILEGLTAEDRTFVKLLCTGTSGASVAAAAANANVPPDRVEQILQSLATVLVDDSFPLRPPGFRGDRLAGEIRQLFAVYGRQSTEILSRRGRAAVRIIGLGRTGAAVAQALLGGGVRTLLLQDERAVTASDVGPGAFRLADIGMNRAAALRRHLLSADPGCQAHVIHPVSSGGQVFSSLDLAVYVGQDVADPNVLAELMGRDQPHLVVLLREQDGAVGPLVIPGQTACQGCIERQLAEVDPDWPQIRRQLEDQAAAEEGSMALELAGSAAYQALLYLDGTNRPASWSAVLTFRGADGGWRQHRYTQHPDCGCQLQRQAAANLQLWDG
ncbi:TOMM precursor leader peptide-binding protein [Paenarthrobacter sp. Z7-10]|uniref:TOMM precursor leader peptide-binding protein n=1 Tax=Paenarthrobacter sp. Z7-10 TaxID=2787635 RepID=UPI0022A8FF37|nr:TOMM precursor leader peptide-binding protein [Paenarthrobacter sp. Z7-10]MCZ2403199.1 TOMM precursor leader peptide-binding protein [Paenarthrobacter sp. Z7-10]